MKIGKAVKKITVLEMQPSGELQPVVAYRAKKGRKKQSVGLRAIEKLARRATEAGIELADAYLARHNRSNAKKRDGWLLDLPRNMMAAQRRGLKRLRLDRLM